MAWSVRALSLILERAERSLRQRIDMSAIDRATVPTYLKFVLSALDELHRVRVVHMDVKPANLFQVIDARSGDPIWKLGDFDSCRRVGEPVGGFTPHYAAPELAAAELDGEPIGADVKMDIFAAGLTILEAATGRRLVPKKEMAERALTILSSRHGGNATTQATDVLQSHLTDVTMPLDPMLRAALRAMLEPYPSRRKDTGALLQAALLSGQVTTAVRHAANKEVLDAISTATTQIVATISQAEARLAEQVEAGNAVVLNQLCAIQRTPLPQLLATTRQQHLEMVCLMDENADNAALRSKAAEAAAEVRAALGQVAGRIEGQDPALVAMMADLVKAQPAQQEAPSGVLSKLDALMRRMDAMGDQFGKLNAKVDTMHAKQVEAFQQLQVKLDQLLLNGHEQVFTHFMMKPLPSKGRMGKVRSARSRRILCAHTSPPPGSLPLPPRVQHPHIQHHCVRAATCTPPRAGARENASQELARQPHAHRAAVQGPEWPSGRGAGGQQVQRVQGVEADRIRKEAPANGAAGHARAQDRHQGRCDPACREHPGGGAQCHWPKHGRADQ